MFFNILPIAVSSVGVPSDSSLELPIVIEEDPHEKDSGSKKNLNTRLSNIESRYQGQDAAEAVLGFFKNFLENPGAYSKNNTDKHSELIDATIMFAKLIKESSDFTGKFKQLVSGAFGSKLKSSENEVKASYIDALFVPLTKKSYKHDEELLKSVFVLLKEVLSCEIMKSNLSSEAVASTDLINFALPMYSDEINKSEELQELYGLIQTLFGIEGKY